MADAQKVIMQHMVMAVDVFIFDTFPAGSPRSGPCAITAAKCIKLELSAAATHTLKTDIDCAVGEI